MTLELDDDGARIMIVEQGVEEMKELVKHHSMRKLLQTPQSDNALLPSKPNTNRQEQEESDDLLLQNRILISRNNDEKFVRCRMEEEIKYLRHLLGQRDKRNNGLSDELTKQDGRCLQLQKLIDEKEAANISMKHSLGQTRQSKEKLESEYLLLKKSKTVEPMSMSLRFAESQNDKLIIMRTKRRLRLVAERHEAASRAFELNLMTAEDERSTLVAAVMVRTLSIKKRRFSIPLVVSSSLLCAKQVESEESDGDDAVFTKSIVGGRPTDKVRRSSSLISFGGVKNYGHGITSAGFQTFKLPLDLTSTEDPYVSAKIAASPFREPLQELRQDLSNLAQRLKDQEDSALSSLLYIFQEAEKRSRGILSNPKGDFARQLNESTRSHQISMRDLMQMFRSYAKKIISLEKVLRAQWIKEGRTLIDQSTQAEIPPPEDPRIAQLTDQLTFLNSRLKAQLKEHTVKLSDMELMRDKAEINMQFLQQKMFELHGGVYEAMHSVYRHRFQWAPRLPNPFADIDKTATKKASLAVQFNVKIAEAVDDELVLLKRFADYFMSDETFGVNMNNAKERERELVAKKSSALWKKEAVPVKKKIDAARQLSTAVHTLLKKELELPSENESAPQQTADDPHAILQSNFLDNSAVCVPDLPLKEVGLAVSMKMRTNKDIVSPSSSFSEAPLIPSAPQSAPSSAFSSRSATPTKHHPKWPPVEPRSQQSSDVPVARPDNIVKCTTPPVSSILTNVPSSWAGIPLPSVYESCTLFSDDVMQTQPLSSHGPNNSTNQQPCPATSKQVKNPTTPQEYTRMAAWQLMQHEMWERKRHSQSFVSPVVGPQLGPLPCAKINLLFDGVPVYHSTQPPQEANLDSTRNPRVKRLSSKEF